MFAEREICCSHGGDHEGYRLLSSHTEKSVEFTNGLEGTMTSSFRAEVKMEAVGSPKTLLNFYQSTR